MWFHIVEDEPELREVMRALFMAEGYYSLEFESAEAYLGFFASSQYIPPVAVIIDNRMPGMSGIELVRYIRKRAPYQKVVIATATLMDIEMAKSELCYELPKPFGYQQLITMIRGLAACEEIYKADPACFMDEVCGFGLEHLCPFAIAA